MNTVQKIGVMIAATGMMTALVLPGRQTVGVVNALANLLNGALRESQGRSK
jgi:hypothetical protein